MSDEDELVVDHELLDTSAAELSNLVTEFNGLGDWKDDLEESLGHGGVQDAMGDFVDNWSVGRKKLVEQLETLGEAIEDSQDAFAGLQTTLINELQETE